MTDQTSDVPFWDVDRYRSSDVSATYDDPHRHTKMRATFESNGSVLFWISIKTALLSILTLGIYRFWMKTRLRRFYWSAVRIDGDPLEYTGTGIEKLLGFLLALVILAIYLGLVNLGLTFLGLSFAPDDPAALNAMLQLSALSVVPVIFYAIYRGNRYMLARTRWRGIRFGLMPGAVGYTWRALLLSLLTLVTLGLAYPYQHYVLTKYITDRSYFGDLRFHQEGSWWELFAQWMWLYVAAGFSGLTIWGVIDNPQDGTIVFLAGLLATFGTAIFLLLYQRYQIAAFRILWSMRSLGETSFDNDLSAGRVIGIYIGGGIAASICTLIVGGSIAFALFYAASQAFDPSVIEAAAQNPTPETILAAAPYLTSAAIAYLVFLAFAFAFSQVFVNMRVSAARVEGMTIINPKALEESRQRMDDEAREAGGFADALGVDVGAGI